MKKVIICCVLMVVGLTGCVRADQPTDLTDVLEQDVPEVTTPEKKAADGLLLPERSSGMGWADKTADDKSGFSPWRSFGTTLCVLAALVAVNLYIRKGKLGRLVKSDAKIKLLERFSVDQKKSLILMEVEGRKVLLGVSPERINQVMSFDADIDEFDEKLSEEINEIPDALEVT